MNQKGFTMVEILVAVTILGLLSAMTIAGYSRYIHLARIEGYNVMVNSAKQAAEDYIMDHPGDATEAEKKDSLATYYMAKKAPTITFDELVEQGYLKRTTDPADKSVSCRGAVRVAYIPGESSKILDQYIYEIDLCCSAYQKEYVYSYQFDNTTPEKAILDRTWNNTYHTVNVTTICNGLAS